MKPRTYVYMIYNKETQRYVTDSMGKNYTYFTLNGARDRAKREDDDIHVFSFVDVIGADSTFPLKPEPPKSRSLPESGI